MVRCKKLQNDKACHTLDGHSYILTPHVAWSSGLLDTKLQNSCHDFTPRDLARKHQRSDVNLLEKLTPCETIYYFHFSYEMSRRFAEPNIIHNPMEADDQSSAGTNHKFTLYSF